MYFFHLSISLLHQSYFFVRYSTVTVVLIEEKKMMIYFLQFWDSIIALCNMQCGLNHNFVNKDTFYIR